MLLQAGNKGYCLTPTPLPLPHIKPKIKQKHQVKHVTSKKKGLPQIGRLVLRSVFMAGHSSWQPLPS